MKWPLVVMLVLVLFLASTGCVSVNLGSGGSVSPEVGTPATCLPGEGCIVLRCVAPIIKGTLMVNDDEIK